MVYVSSSRLSCRRIRTGHCLGLGNWSVPWQRQALLDGYQATRYLELQQVEFDIAELLRWYRILVRVSFAFINTQPRVKSTSM
jgi:hypothetical protein